ncbi:unnamed protein product [Urochloa humidicola]
MWGARPSQLLIVTILLLAVVSSPHSSEARPCPGLITGRVMRSARELNQILSSPPAPTSATTIGTRTAAVVVVAPPPRK